MLSFDATAILFASGVLTLIFYSFFLRNKHSRLPLPPGPAKLPLVGNIFDVPMKFQWETYMEWGKKYNSDIIHLSLAGMSVIVLLSSEATNALLEKRSAIYSDRTPLPMVTELMGWDFNIGPKPLTSSRRTTHRLVREALDHRMVQQYWSLEVTTARSLLQRWLETPDDFFAHLYQMAGEFIMEMAYGIKVQPLNDPYVALAHKTVNLGVIACVPGHFLVNHFPLLKYVPSWFPGAGFQRQAREWKKLARALLDMPFAETERQMASGIYPQSFTADRLDGLRDEKVYYEKEHVKAAAATLFAAGADTTVSALASFVLAMLMHPDAQKQAQAEIDSVTHGKYLPDMNDEALLPYTSALVKEVLRWKNSTPLAMPHVLTMDDEYRGYRLPAGSLVIGNTWAIMHDEATYPDPYAFKPERWLVDGKPNPCKGNHAAREVKGPGVGNPKVN
ncbi:cytochrome P450 [Mycena belliarum]|uniref:Cytochrome P450 n=1 Tax=Mycena belliarum TaxID=1033014 RepID=A0AAD6TTL7_9AGAR|nr:cytochrome P450 [Mycena belliae]